VDELSGPESSTPAPDQGSQAERPDGPATGQGADRDQRPAETLTRGEYARQMREGPRRQGDADAQGRDPPDAPASTSHREARHLAEPRSRAEVADEARARRVRAHVGADAHGTLAETSPYGRVSVAKADRGIGDTTPTGIGLKPSGEQLRDMESDKLSPADRFRKEFYRKATTSRTSARRARTSWRLCSARIRRPVGSGDLDGFSELVYAAFVVAARRYFGLEWTRADVVRYVGSVRARGAGR
jgi:hypothetical protein